jgi:glycosyltransferase involved in cell wall biosynthesis
MPATVVFDNSESYKIGFLSHVLPPSWSGQAVMIRRILKNLPPELYCLLSKRDYSKSSSIHDHSYDDVNKLAATCYRIPSFFILRVWRLIKIIRHERITHLVACSGDRLDIPAAFIAASITGISFVPYYFDDYVYQWPSSLMRLTARMAESTFMKHVAQVIVPNEFLRDAIKSRRGIEPKIVRNPGEYNSIPSISHQNPHGTVREYRIVYTGAVYHVNFSAFVDILKVLDALKRDDIRLHIYTAQPLAFLKKNGICGPRVVYHEHLPAQEVAEIQKSADILLIPFSANSLVAEVVKTSAPAKMGDYLASGVPILAYVPPDTFVGWYLRKNACGVVVENSEAQSLSEAICTLLADESLRRSLVQNAFKCLDEDFSCVIAQQAFLNALHPQNLWVTTHSGSFSSI